SEVMLQQTTVAAVAPRFLQFLDRWPTITALAAAPDADVMAEWAGLGYYARARNLLKCARVVAEEHSGVFPAEEAELLQLPGVGAYTAAAVAAIAFNRPTTPGDENIERVPARLYQIETPLPAAKVEIKARATDMTPAPRPGDFAQAMMDLGATICLPRRPRCLVCPLLNACKARGNGIEASLPKKAPKPVKPMRTGTVYWVKNNDGAVLVRRRQPKGLLGGMVELPSFGWSDDDAPIEVTSLAYQWESAPTAVTHTFTHFHLTLDVQLGEARTDTAPEGCFWITLDNLADVGLPTVIAKAAKAALQGL
ncbi:MAG: A/G-specific adenine glycosylase, partial [Alphaproteobacteria bacterium]